MDGQVLCVFLYKNKRKLLMKNVENFLNRFFTKNKLKTKNLETKKNSSKKNH